MTNKGWIELGRIGAPNGVRGWVKVQSFMARPEDIFERRDWLVRSADDLRAPLTLVEWRQHGDGWIAKFAGIDERNGAAKLTGAWIEIERERLPPTASSEYYLSDLVGLEVRNLEGSVLGVVDHFVTTPGNDVMVVRGERDHWLPVTQQHLLRVNQASRSIEVDWPVDF
ncbi:MAG: 16S rRNA processing protein RimM [Pseudomonadales bacterium]|mgnify:CR=1 FL=1|nr:16S rRNA processing protein RimM [Pseudomonadales bacterium]